MLIIICNYVIIRPFLYLVVLTNDNFTIHLYFKVKKYIYFTRNGNQTFLFFQEKVKGVRLNLSW